MLRTTLRERLVAQLMRSNKRRREQGYDHRIPAQLHQMQQDLSLRKLIERSNHVGQNSAPQH